ncbi:MAG TPA: hypothetical protein VNM69_18055 [Bacillus sp. (in: firmicutes)]|nr:hypothetical protein [Bacillus sp. (in: firmicutes)]
MNAKEAKKYLEGLRKSEEGYYKSTEKEWDKMREQIERLSLYAKQENNSHVLFKEFSHLQRIFLESKGLWEEFEEFCKEVGYELD